MRVRSVGLAEDVDAHRPTQLCRVEWRQVEDGPAGVDALYSELTGAGYHGSQPPWDAFWGSRFAVVEDPEGNAVGLMSRPEAEHRTAPPDPTGFSNQR